MGGDAPKCESKRGERPRDPNTHQLVGLASFLISSTQAVSDGSERSAIGVRASPASTCWLQRSAAARSRASGGVHVQRRWVIRPVANLQQSAHCPLLVVDTTCVSLSVLSVDYDALYYPSTVCCERKRAPGGGGSQTLRPAPRAAATGASAAAKCCPPAGAALGPAATPTLVALRRRIVRAPQCYHGASRGRRRPTSSCREGTVVEKTQSRTDVV